MKATERAKRTYLVPSFINLLPVSTKILQLAGPPARSYPPFLFTMSINTVEVVLKRLTGFDERGAGVEMRIFGVEYVPLFVWQRRLES